MIKENLVKTIEKSLIENRILPALSDYNGSTYTYENVSADILRLHKLFKFSGIKAGDKIALIGKNSANWGIVFLATVTYGAVTVPILPDFTREDVCNIINHSDSVMLFTGDNAVEDSDLCEFKALKAIFSLKDYSLVRNNKIKELDNFLSSDSFSDVTNDVDQFYNRTLQFDAIPNENLAEISYTSGTMGFSKGVMLSHNSLIANIIFAHENMPLHPGDRIVSFLPLAHSYGCAFEFLFPLTLGCHVTFLTKTPSPQIIMQAFGEIKPNLILSVPLVIEKIFKKQILPVIHNNPVKTLLKIPGVNQIILNKIKKKLTTIFGGEFCEVVIGGAPFNAEAELFFKRIKFPFSIGYGMTECGPLISYSPWNKTKLTSSGKLVDTLELKIDSEDPYNVVGEILIRGENVMDGYYKNEEATRNALDNEGWLHTGDLGVTDADGMIYIRGRSKSMILGASGQNIYPEEIEARINNLDYIQESIVIEKNQKLIALIYPDYESIKNAALTDEHVKKIMNHNRSLINNQTPSYMIISEFIMMDQEFQKTPKRSIKRFMYGQ